MSVPRSGRSGDNNAVHYDEIEADVQHGLLREARQKLIPLTRSTPPRAELARVASLFRRAWMPEQALAILHRVVRPPARTRKGSDATPAEKLEYATSLVLVGAHREAESILSSLNAQENPEVHFARGLARFREWDWKGTLGYWDQLQASPHASPLQRLRGRIYLANALTFGLGRYSESLEICEKIAVEASAQKHRMIHKSRLLLAQQNHALQGDARSARTAFDQIRVLCEEESDERFLLHSLLWQAIAEKDPDGIRSARAGFKDRRDWEETRICDYHLARVTEDRQALIHLYFGTPYPEFRSRVAELLGGDGEIPGSYEWKLWDGQSLSPVVFDLEAGTNSRSRAYLKRGQALHRCMRALSEDFFLPPSVARIHEVVYPGSYFNPASSPDRVHQLLRRFRAWFKENDLPLEVRESSGVYRLFSPAGCTIRIDREPPASGVVDPGIMGHADRLWENFGQTPFSSSEAADCLDVSGTSAKRILSHALSAGLISRNGKGPGTRYSMICRPGRNPRK